MYLRLQKNGVRPLFFFLRSLYGYSTTAAAVDSQSNFLVDYLINSLEFSEEDALSLVSKRSVRKSCRRDPSLVVNFLEEIGLNKNQIKSIVSADPRVLSYDVDKTLKPKIRVFQDIGISGSDFVGVIMHHKSLLCRGLSAFVPAIEYLRKLLGTDENVAAVIKKCTPLLDSYGGIKLMSRNVELLKRAGFSNEKVTKFVVSTPKRMIRKTEYFEKDVQRVESEFGISRDSKMFYRGVQVVSSFTETKINSKLKVFSSYGWNHANIYQLVRTLPVVLSKSGAKIQEALSFYTEELGCTPHYIASHPALLTYSLERRVKPRWEVFKVLEEKKLMKRKLSLYSAVCATDLKFVNGYILPFKDELPDLYESYMKSSGS